MFIEPYNVNMFEEFCYHTSQSEFEYSKGGNQPDIKFKWLDSHFWGYKKAGGYSIHGEELDILHSTWNNALKTLEEADGEGRKNGGAG